ncbi:cellulose biosynthesis cyclic di-GMP-binding regulatory protein BcsB [Zestomonas carbonaria]|uniref:Cyclic di-GMP-binding protein n=1 Tax=Zestomonas carbonaria TaxID=2762745 RepID=A0A7U7ER54_9GAMM|nr:cellulose biosynthesis cyclic di-GMP-binding regulatory protein BcsB [Pseudomonas carbonaria]CAD5109613.1 Cyclic di-GMP-binding protein [Pseudomonas carbonaria]
MNTPHLIRSALLGVAAAFAPLAVLASPAPTVDATEVVLERSIGLAELSSPGALVVRNVLRNLYAEFGVRSDELISAAELQLIYTPSPSMNTELSHIKVYLNDELMGVLPVLRPDPGREIEQQVRLDTDFVRDFNHLRLELVGSHDRGSAEDPLHAGLWVDFSANSRLRLEVQRLRLKNDLAILPEPFFDHRDNSRLDLPFVFASAPGPSAQTAAAILASWFGIHSSWRGASFPVAFDALPDNRSAVVFASNDRRPAFLRDYPGVDAPTVAIIDHPANPYAKLLLVLGQDDQALITAARAIALGGFGLKGQSIEVREPIETPRQPYDAPNWVRSDRPTTFQELLDNPQQLETTGLIPRPLTLNLNVPPDLFVWHSRGVPMELRYRYTPPLQKESSLLSISLNDHFIQAFPLDDREPSLAAGLAQSSLPLFTSGPGGRKVLIPPLRIAPRNELRLDFTFNALPGCRDTSNCATSLPMQIQAAVDPESSIDFSGFHHYKAMPDLQAFAAAGYPFSRLADLSQTQVLMPAQASPPQLALLLALLARIGAYTGYPATGLHIADDWQQARQSLDLLLIGTLPEAFVNELPTEQNALLERTAGAAPVGLVGFQSPFDDQRSVVAVLAGEDEGYRLLEQSLRSPERLARIGGATTLVSSGRIESLAAADPYYVGSLPWWLLIWFHLADHTLFLLLLAVLGTLLLASAIFSALSLLARRRLQESD